MIILWYEKKHVIKEKQNIMYKTTGSLKQQMYRYINYKR